LQNNLECMQTRGHKQYEPSRRCEALREPSSLIPLKIYNNKQLSNHLGNVLATITDRKLNQFVSSSGMAGISYFEPDIVSLTDYYPFGSEMKGRAYSSGSYKYGFNTQEKDEQIYGEGNSTTAEYWQFDARLGRMWNKDPVTYPWNSSYACFNDNPYSSIIYQSDIIDF